MFQNYLKMEHPEIKNTCYGYQNLRPRCHLQGETPIKVSFAFIHHLRTFWVERMRDTNNLQLSTWSNLCDTKPDWITQQTWAITWNSEAISCVLRESSQTMTVVTNRSIFINSSSTGFFRPQEGGYRWLANHNHDLNWPKNIQNLVILEVRITVFTCLLSNEGCDSVFKHLNLALAPEKTN